MVQTSGREEDSQQKQPTKSKNRLFGSLATEQHDGLAWLFFLCKIFFRAELSLGCCAEYLSMFLALSAQEEMKTCYLFDHNPKNAMTSHDGWNWRFFSRHKLLEVFYTRQQVFKRSAFRWIFLMEPVLWYDKLSGEWTTQLKNYGQFKLDDLLPCFGLKIEKICARYTARRWPYGFGQSKNWGVVRISVSLQ